MEFRASHPMNCWQFRFVYALGDEGSRRIIYVEIIFCNYFMDLDYQKYIAAEYLPDGFDASRGNPYRKKLEGRL